MLEGVHAHKLKMQASQTTLGSLETLRGVFPRFPLLLFKLTFEAFLHFQLISVFFRRQRQLFQVFYIRCLNLLRVLLSFLRLNHVPFSH